MEIFGFRLWQRVWAHPRGAGALLLLLGLYLAAFLAPFLSPYPVASQDLKKTYHPPMRLVWKEGAIQVRRYRNMDPTAAAYVPVEDETIPVRWWTRGFEYRFLGVITTSRHLFGVEAPERIYLLGSDGTGRDVFSRLLYGARISLSIGLIGVGMTMALGLVFGGLAGYFGGIGDDLTMRTTELLMAIPGLYLLLALRSALAHRFSSDQMFILIVVILSLIGWSGTARVIRGLTLSLRERPFIKAAEAMGQTPWKILWRHLLPNTFSYLIVAATLSIPGYILGEAALSFLNVGIQEPDASWGLMLSQAQEMKVFMLNFWWLLTPGVAILMTVVAFNVLGDVLRDIVDPKFRMTS